MSTVRDAPDSWPHDEPAAVTVRLLNESLSADLARLRNRLATGVLEGRGLTLDVSAVDELSSPTVAAILWARRSCVARNLPFTVTGHRGRTHRILRSCGLVEPVRPRRRRR
jgi:anti-anti-sigma regulatory factor